MEMSKGGDPTVLCPTGQGEAQGCGTEENPVLPAPGEVLDSGMVEGCQWVGSRARIDPLLYTKTHQCLHNGCSRNRVSAISPTASLHLPDFVLVTLYYPMDEQGPQTPTAWLTSATLLPVTASAPADHHHARLPQAAPAFLRELPSAHNRVWTP